VTFREAVFGGRVFWQRDISLYWYPQAEAFVRVVAGGAWPLWNPYMAFGLPLLADPSYQILYPFTWLNLVLFPDTFYKLYVVFHVSAAGIGLYLFSRRMGLGRWAAFASSAAWVLSGPLLVVVSHTHHLAGTAWIPWVLLALDVALRRGRARDAALLAVVVAAQVLAGSADLCLMTAFAAAGYALVHAVGGPGRLRDRIKAVGVAAGAGAPLAALLSAVQWMPTLGILSYGQRLQLDPAVKMYWSLHPASLLDFVVPRLVNDLPVNPAARTALFESREPLFACLYVGAAGAALVASSLLLPWNRFKAYGVMGLAFSLLTALGRHTPFYGLLLRTTPLFLFRYPEKYVILVGLFWAVLVGLAVEDWLGQGGERRDRRLPRAVVAAWLPAVALLGGSWGVVASPSRLLEVVSPMDPLERHALVNGVSAKLAQAGAVAALVAVAAWLLGRARGRERGALVAAVTVLLLLDVGSVGSRANPLAPAGLMTHRPPLLEEVPGGSRVWVSMVHPPGWLESQVIRGPASWQWQWWWARGLEDLLWPPAAARWGLRGSYDGDFTGLALPLLSNMTLILRNAVGTPIGARVLQMGGVDYVATLDEWPGLSLVREYESTFSAPVKLYRVPATLSKTYVVDRVRVAPEPTSVETIADPAFDPVREIIVPPGARVPRAVAGFEGRSHESWRRADSIGVDCVVNGEAYVVFLEAFFPGWRARVDGRSVAHTRANVLFLAVPVPAGRHRVVLEYRPPSVRWGIALSAVGVGLVLLLSLASRRGSGTGV
jgi:hypothetical protein